MKLRLAAGLLLVLVSCANESPSSPFDQVASNLISTAESTSTTTTTTTATTSAAATATTTTSATTTTTTSATPLSSAVSSGREISDDPLPRADLFDAAFELNVLTAGSVDVSVAVMFQGEIVHTYASSSAKSSRPVDPNTSFRIASVSKILTAETVMKLVDQGRVQLDDRVVDDIAQSMGITLADERARNITIRQLLSHTSGLSNFLKIFFDVGTYDQTSMLTEVLGQSLASEPGSSYKYSNVNYVLLGKAIELATGSTYEDAVRVSILEPLGADSFRLTDTYEFAERDARHAVSANRTYMEQLGAAGAWVATASDVARMVSVIDEDFAVVPLLTAQSTRTMKTPATPTGVAPTWDYGLGLRLFSSGEWGHSGSIENVHALAVKRPDGLIVAALVNGSKPKETDDLLRIINDAVLAARTGVAATTTVP